MKLWWLCCVVFGHFIQCQAAVLFENSTCPGGICTKFDDCPQAVESVQTKHFHNFERCSFFGSTEIVCCPPQFRQLPPRRRENKSKKACKKYTDDNTIDLEFQIANGRDALYAPYIAALGFDDRANKRYKFQCGGVLISEKYVLTAAHCLINQEEEEVKIVRLGSVNVPLFVEKIDEKLDYEVGKVIIHSEYKRRKKLNDIALIELKKSVDFTETIQPACLYNNGTHYPQDFIILGWGDVDNNSSKPVKLQKGFVTFEPHDACNSRYTKKGNPLLDNQLCATDSKNDICGGDSGGPLMMRYSEMAVVVGIASFGQPGCWGGHPSVYSSVVKHLDWIEKYVWSDDF